ncbi:uncharacterized protein PITG_09319 [Phytophthora infestans T30-4]|uniref:Uncharacterized protein n=1 Tax=Phytophthora infestans (strain T30-4) TaxID=403677 RepID=D0NBE9_PHYIT|nr:uncharacterized protein PITG_09319 [Phytophthora infestans T30-4]EEY55378.1 hypothetical protein PITG_09319 [Phytophthora infestans T30-4]|eukprot:XP_002903602.1 hypothetical protein PITG_09319 [Phytophthora infestans T30-4]
MFPSIKQRKNRSQRLKGHEGFSITKYAGKMETAPRQGLGQRLIDRFPEELGVTDNTFKIHVGGWTLVLFGTVAFDGLSELVVKSWETLGKAQLNGNRTKTRKALLRERIPLEHDWDNPFWGNDEIKMIRPKPPFMKGGKRYWNIEFKEGEEASTLGLKN